MTGVTRGLKGRGRDIKKERSGEEGGSLGLAKHPETKLAQIIPELEVCRERAKCELSNPVYLCSNPTRCLCSRSHGQLSYYLTALAFSSAKYKMVTALVSQSFHAG